MIVLIMHLEYKATRAWQPAARRPNLIDIMDLVGAGFVARSSV